LRLLKVFETDKPVKHARGSNQFDRLQAKKSDFLLLAVETVESAIYKKKREDLDHSCDFAFRR
jgi:hypothetical protein